MEKTVLPTVAVIAFEAAPEAARMRPARRRRLAELQAGTGIAFIRYYRPALMERLATLLDTLAYLPLAAWRVAVTLAMVVVGWFAFCFRLTPWASVPLLVWAIAGGLVVGAVIALRAVVRRGLQHVDEVFDESLDLVAAILDDSARVSASERPPEWKDLVEGTLLAVVFPALEAALRQRLWFLAWPVVNLLEWTLLRVAKKVNAEVESALLAAPGTAPRETVESLRAASSTARAIVGKVSRAAAVTVSVPLTALAVLAALVFGVPMALATWIF